MAPKHTTGLSPLSQALTPGEGQQGVRARIQGLVSLTQVFLFLFLTIKCPTHPSVSRKAFKIA